MYGLLKSNVTIEGKTYPTYGIEAGDLKIPDVSTEQSKVKNLVNWMNTLELDPIHIDDIIEDFLGA